MQVNLEPTLSVSGYNLPTSTLLGDHGNVRSSKKPKLAAKYGLHHTWEHTWPIRNESYLHDVCTCSGLKILIIGEFDSF